MASPTEDRRSRQRLVERVLGDASFFPDAFEAWIPRVLQNNVNFKATQFQLPDLEPRRLVGATGNAAFQNSWVNYGGTNEQAHYWKDSFNMIHIGGVVKSGTITATIFTLPAGYRPQEALIMPVASNGAFGVVTINPDGTIVASAGSNVYFSLSGISFRQFA